MAKYQERIARYRIVYRTIITDPRVRAEYEINGINPDDSWSLQWSFETEEDANAQLAEELSYGFKSREYKIIDNGQEEIIEREAFF